MGVGGWGIKVKDRESMPHQSGNGGSKLVISVVASTQCKINTNLHPLHVKA